MTIPSKEYMKDYMREKRARLKAEAKPLPAIEPEDFPPHACVQKDAQGHPVKYVEDPNYAKMCQYVYCRKPATGTTRVSGVFTNEFRVCDKHKAMVEWVDPNAPTLKPDDQPESDEDL